MSGSYGDCKTEEAMKLVRLGNSVSAIAAKQAGGVPGTRPYDVARVLQWIINNNPVVPRLFPMSTEESQIRKIMGPNCFTPYDWAHLTGIFEEMPALPISIEKLAAMVEESCQPLKGLRISRGQYSSYPQGSSVRDTHFLFCVPRKFSLLDVGELPFPVQWHLDPSADLREKPYAKDNKTRFDWYLMLMGMMEMEDKIFAYEDQCQVLAEAGYASLLACEFALFQAIWYMRQHKPHKMTSLLEGGGYACCRDTYQKGGERHQVAINDLGGCLRFDDTELFQPEHPSNPRPILAMKRLEG